MVVVRNPKNLPQTSLMENVLFLGDCCCYFRSFTITQHRRQYDSVVQLKLNFRDGFELFQIFSIFSSCFTDSYSDTDFRFSIICQDSTQVQKTANVSSKMTSNRYWGPSFTEAPTVITLVFSLLIHIPILQATSSRQSIGRCSPSLVSTNNAISPAK